MSAPKGFGRNYFSLASIQAYTSAVTLSAHTVSMRQKELVLAFGEDDADDPTEPELLCESTLSLESDSYYLCVQTPVHCNCVFKRKTRNAIIQALLKQKPRYICRKILTGIAPPLSLLLLTKRL